MLQRDLHFFKFSCQTNVTFAHDQSSMTIMRYVLIIVGYYVVDRKCNRF